MREVRGKYKRTALGQGWSLLNPLATLAMFTLVFGVLLGAEPPAGDPSGLDVFALWLAAGLLPWTFFSGAMSAGMQPLLVNANLMKKVYFPRELLVGSTVFSFVVTFAVELAVLTVLLLFGANPRPRDEIGELALGADSPCYSRCTCGARSRTTPRASSSNRDRAASACRGLSRKMSMANP